MGSKLLIGNLSLETEESVLLELFSRIGSVESVELVMDQQTGRRKGFAFVEMSSTVESKKALKLDGTNIGGRPIIVNACKPVQETAGLSFFAKFFNFLHT
jgi:RNA recognition motif-containing protein